MVDYGGATYTYEPLGTRNTRGDDDDEEGNYELQVRP